MFDGTTPPPANVPGGPLVPVFGRSPGGTAGYAYTPELGAAIAEEYGYAPEGGLSGLHAMAPDRIPPPAIVRAWCRQYPAFGLLMREAEKVRAECVIEQTVVIADSGQGTPARLALQIAARHKLAASLDPGRFGQSSGQGASAPQLPHDAQPVAPELSDDQLAQLALAGQAAGGGGSPP